MSDDSHDRPFYRKGCTAEAWYEVNGDGKGGLWLHAANFSEDAIPLKYTPIHFSSIESYNQFLARLLYDVDQPFTREEPVGFSRCKVPSFGVK